jgi:hypothetical protein
LCSWTKERNNVRNTSKLAKVKRMKTVIITAEKEVRRVRDNSPKLRRLNNESNNEQQHPVELAGASHYSLSEYSSVKKCDSVVPAQISLSTASQVFLPLLGSYLWEINPHASRNSKFGLRLND